MPVIKKPNRRKSTLFLALAGIIILATLSGIFIYLRHNNAPSKQTTPPHQQGNTINYGPPTSAEQQAGDQQKQQNADKQTQQLANTATVIISNTSQSGSTVRVRAFVSNAVESGGVCTTVLTRSGQTVSQQTAAFPDASTTQCGAIDFNRSQFNSSGTWQVTVTYKSSGLSGSSTGNITID